MKGKKVLLHSSKLVKKIKEPFSETTNFYTLVLKGEQLLAGIKAKSKCANQSRPLGFK